MAEHSGMIKRVRFSYRAKSRSIFVGTLCDMVGPFAMDCSYAAIFLELRCDTS